MVMVKWSCLELDYCGGLMDLSSKMATGSHFVKKKLRIDLKWREMRSKVIFGHPKWPPATIL